LKALTAALAPMLRAAPDGASVVALDFDASVAWPAYDWMGVAKAALESVARYLARDLGPDGVRVNLVASGPIRTLAAGAIPGFDGLELSTMLSDTLGEEVEVTLIDHGDAFVFGYAKLAVMYGQKTPDAVKLPYAEIAKPGVRFVKEAITAIDAENRRVTTDG